MKSRFRIIIIITTLLVALDQATKYWAWLNLKGAPVSSYWNGALRLSFHENPGAFLSMGADWPPAVRIAIFIGLTSLFLIYLLYYLLSDQELNRVAIIFGAMMFAGGIGNLIDRIFFENGVIDFLNVGVGRFRTGIFNVADMAIMVGVFGMFIFGRPSAEDEPVATDIVEEGLDGQPNQLAEREGEINETARTIEPEN